MTNADINIFVEELQKTNPEKKEDIRVGNFDTVVYTGGDPRELVSPYPFVWVEEENAFSDLPTLKLLGEPPLFQTFYVKCEMKN